MRVCLTIPPSGFLIDAKVFPSLGVLKVAASLEAAGHDVHVLDLSGVADIGAATHECGADVYGMTATMPQMPAAAVVARILRQRGKRMILGGPHVTLLNASARREPESGRSRKMLAELLTLFDALVAGDGERAVFRALEEDGIIDADDPRSDFWLSKKDLEDAPLAARHLIDMESYHYQIDGARTHSLIAQLGCLARGTMVKLASGSEIPIEQVRRGEKVVCLDENTGALSAAPVVATWSRPADDLWELEWADGRVLHVTGEHPLWTMDGWSEVCRVGIGTEVGYLCEVPPPDRQAQEGHSPTRGILAHEEGRADRRKGLSLSRMDGVGSLVQGVTSKESSHASGEAYEIRYSPVVAKRFVGRSHVYNITVCPGHSYVANRVVVHNCPFECGFCGGRRSPFLRRVRTRSTESVLAEMRHLHDAYGARGFMFLDDELNVSPAFPELLRGIIGLRRELGDLKMRGLLKSELLTEDHAVLMRKAGFRQVLVGFESGDPRMLLNMNKKATRAQNTRCVEILRRNGITVKALMSIGHPGESRASVAATRDWLMEVRPDDFDVTIITVYPGTPYYEDAVETDVAWTYTAKNGDRLHAQHLDHLKDVNFYKGIPNSYRSFVWTDHLSREDLVSLRDETEAVCRAELAIPYPTAAAEVNLEHSMGMSA